MIDNSAFSLTDEELASYNASSRNIAIDMGKVEMEFWTLKVT